MIYMLFLAKNTSKLKKKLFKKRPKSSFWLIIFHISLKKNPLFDVDLFSRTFHMESPLCTYAQDPIEEPEPRLWVSTTAMSAYTRSVNVSFSLEDRETLWWSSFVKRNQLYFSLDKKQHENIAPTWKRQHLYTSKDLAKTISPEKWVKCNKSALATKQRKIYLTTRMSKVKLVHIFRINTYVI